MARMSREANGLLFPVSKPEKCPNTQSPKPGSVRPFGRFETPIVIALWARGMDPRIHGPIISLLVNHKPFRAGVHQLFILHIIARTNFKRNAGYHLVHRANALSEIFLGNKLWMFPCHQQHASEALFTKGMGLAQ